MSVEIFIKQHTEILEMVCALEEKLNVTVLQNETDAFGALFRKMLSALARHLTFEDKVMYPKMLASQNPEIVKQAEKFQTEMMSLYPIVLGYRRKWYVAANIAKRPEQFIAETKEIFAALRQRIDCENNVLYPKYTAELNS